MKTKKIICVILSVLCLLFTQMLTVSAVTYSENSGKRIFNFTDEELLEEVWELELWSNYSEDDLLSNKIFLVSITRSELVEFMRDYEPINRDVTVGDVSREFNDYILEKYDAIEFDVDENNNYYEYNVDNPDEKFYYSYDEATDQYVCKDNSGKIMKTYAKYHYEGEDLTYSEADSSSSSAEQSDVGDYNESYSSASSGSSSSSVSYAEAEVATAIVEATTEQPTEVQSDDSGMSNTQIVILVVLGVLVAIGAVVAIVMVIKKRDKVK